MARKSSKKAKNTVETLVEASAEVMKLETALPEAPTLAASDIDATLDLIETQEVGVQVWPSIQSEVIPEDADFIPLDHMQTQAASWDDPAVQDAEPVQVSEAEADTAAKFDVLLTAVYDGEADTVAHEIAAQLDERATIEQLKSPDNASIQRTIKSARKMMVTKRAARVLIACNVNPSFITRNSSENQRYNVYAIGKIADAIFALSGGEVSNAINRAVMRTMFKFRDAGVPFTMENAKQACSQNIRVSDVKIKDLLIRHTVSPSTAPTQAGSTMQALETLGVVKRDGSKNPTYTIIDSPVTEKLKEVLMKAA